MKRGFVPVCLRSMPLQEKNPKEENRNKKTYLVVAVRQPAGHRAGGSPLRRGQQRGRGRRIRSAPDPQPRLIIKATDSDYCGGGRASATWTARLDHPDKAKVGAPAYGPTSEADIDKRIAVYEDIISRKPDGMVDRLHQLRRLGAGPGEGHRPGDRRTVTIDNGSSWDEIPAFLATNNLVGEALRPRRVNSAEGRYRSKTRSLIGAWPDPGLEKQRQRLAGKR